MTNQSRANEALPLLRAHFAADRTSVALPPVALLINLGQVDAGDVQAQALLETYAAGTTASTIRDAVGLQARH